MDGLPASVDHDILAHRSIAAIATIRETLGCTVHQAVDAYTPVRWGWTCLGPDDFRPIPDEHGR